MAIPPVIQKAKKTGTGETPAATPNPNPRPEREPSADLARLGTQAKERGEPRKAHASHETFLPEEKSQ